MDNQYMRDPIIRRAILLLRRKRTSYVLFALRRKKARHRLDIRL